MGTVPEETGTYAVCGFEAADPTIDGLHALSNGAYATDQVYSGDYSYKCTALQGARVQTINDRVLDEDGQLHVRWQSEVVDFAFRVDALPGAPLPILALQGYGDGETIQWTDVLDGSSGGVNFYETGPPLDPGTLYDIVQLRLLPDGAVEHYNPRYGEWIKRSPAGTVTAGQWHHVYMHGRQPIFGSPSWGVFYWAVDGSSSAGWTQNPSFPTDPLRADPGEGDQLGILTTNPVDANLPHYRGFDSVFASVGNGGAAGTVWVDDLRYKPVGGGLFTLDRYSVAGIGEIDEHNPSRMYLLRPVDTLDPGGWTQPSGSTTDLHESLNNQPPTATADPGTDGSQVRSDAAAPDKLVVELDSPTEAGVPADHLIKSLTVIAAVATSAEPAPSGTLYANYGGRFAASNVYSDYAPRAIDFGDVASGWPSGWTLTQHLRGEAVGGGADPTVQQLRIPRDWRASIEVTRTSAGEGHLAFVGVLVEAVDALGIPVLETAPQFIQPDGIESLRAAHRPVVTLGEDRHADGDELIPLDPGLTENDNQFFAHVAADGSIELVGQLWSYPSPEDMFFSFTDFGRTDLAPEEGHGIGTKFDVPDPWFIDNDGLIYTELPYGQNRFGESALYYLEYPWAWFDFNAVHPGYVRMDHRLNLRYTHPVPPPPPDAVPPTPRVALGRQASPGVVRLGRRG